MVVGNVCILLRIGDKCVHHTRGFDRQVIYDTGTGSTYIILSLIHTVYSTGRSS
jgi:hypothetical protein